MFGLVGMNTKQVNWNKEYCLSPELLAVFAEYDLQIIKIIVGRCWSVNNAQ